MKPNDPFGEDVYQDPATIKSTKKPDDGFSEESICKDPTLTKEIDKDPYEDFQTAVIYRTIQHC